MPTRIEADLFNLGVRLKQAVLLTRFDGQISDDRFVHAIVMRLQSAVDLVIFGGKQPPAVAQTLERLKAGCSWMLDKLPRGRSDDYLEQLYSNFNRRALLAADELIARNESSNPGWLELGLEIADGWYSGLKPGDADRLSQGEVETHWRWANPDRVRQLADGIGAKLDELFPQEFASDAAWLNDVPESWVSWARLETGLLRLVRAANDGPEDKRLGPQSETKSDGHDTVKLNRLPVTYRNIYKLLEAAGRRLTTNEIQTEYQKLYGPAGESTIKNALAVMVRDKILDNRSDEDPRGYGILMKLQ